MLDATKASEHDAIVIGAQGANVPRIFAIFSECLSTRTLRVRKNGRDEKGLEASSDPLTVRVVKIIRALVGQMPPAMQEAAKGALSCELKTNFERLLVCGDNCSHGHAHGGGGHGHAHGHAHGGHAAHGSGDHGHGHGGGHGHGPHRARPHARPSVGHKVPSNT